jgi:hypothetical protein
MMVVLFIPFDKKSNIFKGGENEKVSYDYSFGHSALFYLWLPAG